MGVVEDDDYADKKILVTEAADNPLKNRRIMAERLFEYIGFDAFQLVVQGMMSLFAEVRSILSKSFIYKRDCKQRVWWIVVMVCRMLFRFMMERS